MLAALVLCGGLEAGLAERVSFDLVETPFAEAIKFIKKRAGLRIVLDEDRLKGFLSCPVTLLSDGLTVREALRWITRLACADFAVVDGEIRISTVKALLSENVALRIHDIRDLTKPIPCLAGVNPLPMDVSYSSGNGACTCFFQGVAGYAIEPGSLAELIQTQLQPETWLPGLGTYVEERGGELIARHRPEMHAEIERLLDECRRTSLRTIAISVEELVLPAEEVRKPFPLFLTSSTADGLRRKALESRSANVVCMNGQKVRSIGGSFRRFLADFDVTGGSHAPLAGILNAGLSLTVQPELSWDGRAVTVRSEIASHRDPELLTFSPFSGPATGKAERDAFVPGALELPRMKVIILSPCFRLPLGMSALLWAGEENRAFLVSADLVRP